jgi:hypothetical protein
VARPDGDRQRVHPRPLHELDSLVRVGQMNLAGPDAVFYAPQGPELALDGDADLVGHLDHLARDAHVVLEIGWRLAVVHQRPVHHHAGEA